MRRVALILAATAALAFCGTALAGLDPTNAYTDGGGTTWVGTTNMDNGNLGADVDWVVNAPVLKNGLMQFEYLYQVKSLDSLPVTLLTVNLLPGNAVDEVLGCGSFLTQAGDIAPTASYLSGSPPSGANWNFAGLVAGDDSYALHYWSINEPRESGGLIQDGGLYAAAGALPCPAPEPAGLSLLAVGLLALVRRRRP